MVQNVITIWFGNYLITRIDLQNSCTEKRDMAKRKSSRSIKAQSFPKGKGSKGRQAIVIAIGDFVLEAIIVVILALRNSQSHVTPSHTPLTAACILAVHAYPGLT